MATEQYIKCSKCTYNRNLFINLICEDCQKPLFRVQWWWFISLILAIFTIGYLIGHQRNTWIPNILVDILFIIYILIVFRKDTFGKSLYIFVAAITLPVVFIAFHADELITKDTNNQTLIFTKTMTFVSIGTGILYLFYHYFSEWQNVCRESNTGWFRGLSVITFTLYLISLTIDFTNQYIGLLNTETILFIEKQIHARTILLVLIMIHTLSAAFINSSNRIITRPIDIFTNKKITINPWNPKPFKNPLLNSFIIMIKSLVNVSLAFYNNLIQGLMVIANTTKVTIEYIIKLLINYSL